MEDGEESFVHNGSHRDFLQVVPALCQSFFAKKSKTQSQVRGSAFQQSPSRMGMRGINASVEVSQTLLRHVIRLLGCVGRCDTPPLPGHSQPHRSSLLGWGAWDSGSGDVGRAAWIL